MKKRATITITEVDNGFTVVLQGGGVTRGATKIAKDAKEATAIATEMINEALNPPTQKEG